jgi:multidrug resistance efflux pump
MFFSGSGQISPEPVRQPGNPAPIRTAQVFRNDTVSDSPEPISSVVIEPDPELDALQSEQGRLQSARDSLAATVSEAVGVTGLKQQYTEATQSLETMKSISRDINVQAPVYGMVGEVRFQQGDDVPDGEIMLRILHTDRRYIMVHLPTRRVHEMQSEQEVDLIFPGHQSFRGRIVDVPLLAETTGDTGETLAAVRIEPVGRLWPMVPVGSQIDVISHKR